MYPYYDASDAVLDLAIKASVSSVQLYTVGRVELVRGTCTGWRVLLTIDIYFIESVERQ